MNTMQLKTLRDLLGEFMKENPSMGKTQDIAEIHDKLEAEANDFKLRRKLIADERRMVEAHYKGELDKLRVKLSELQKKCPHQHTQYHPDASGNNDSSTECLDCGAEL